MNMRQGTNHKEVGTHMLTLIKAVQMTDGAVCELGGGYSSTPLLHWLCLGRELVSYENNPDYYHYQRQFRSRNHKVRLVKDFKEVDFKRHWSVVLIDHSLKKPLSRGLDAIKFKDSADFVVLHDTEPESIENYGYDKVWPHFKYRYDWTLCKPYTTVLSNTMDVCTLFQ